MLYFENDYSEALMATFGETDEDQYGKAARIRRGSLQ